MPRQTVSEAELLAIITDPEMPQAAKDAAQAALDAWHARIGGGFGAAGLGGFPGFGHIPAPPSRGGPGMVGFGAGGSGHGAGGGNFPPLPVPPMGFGGAAPLPGYGIGYPGSPLPPPPHWMAAQMSSGQTHWMAAAMGGSGAQLSANLPQALLMRDVIREEIKLRKERNAIEQRVANMRILEEHGLFRGGVMIAQHAMDSSGMTQFGNRAFFGGMGAMGVLAASAGPALGGTLGGSWQMALGELGRVFLPSIMQFSKTLQDVANWLRDLPPWVKEMINVIGKFVFIMGGAIVAVRGTLALAGFVSRGFGIPAAIAALGIGGVGGGGGGRAAPGNIALGGGFGGRLGTAAGIAGAGFLADELVGGGGYIGAAATGAAIGNMIFPGIGAPIGAGIGTLARAGMDRPPAAGSPLDLFERWFGPGGNGSLSWATGALSAMPGAFGGAPASDVQARQGRGRQMLVSLGFESQQIAVEDLHDFIQRESVRDPMQQRLIEDAARSVIMMEAWLNANGASILGEGDTAFPETGF